MSDTVRRVQEGARRAQQERADAAAARVLSGTSAVHGVREGARRAQQERADAAAARVLSGTSAVHGVREGARRAQQERANAAAARVSRAGAGAGGGNPLSLAAGPPMTSDAHPGRVSFDGGQTWITRGSATQAGATWLPFTGNTTQTPAAAAGPVSPGINFSQRQRLGILHNPDLPLPPAAEIRAQLVREYQAVEEAKQRIQALKGVRAVIDSANNLLADAHEYLMASGSYLAVMQELADYLPLVQGLIKDFEAGRARAQAKLWQEGTQMFLDIEAQVTQTIIDLAIQSVNDFNDMRAESGVQFYHDALQVMDHQVKILLSLGRGGYLKDAQLAQSWEEALNGSEEAMQSIITVVEEAEAGAEEMIDAEDAERYAAEYEAELEDPDPWGTQAEQFAKSLEGGRRKTRRSKARRSKAHRSKAHRSKARRSKARRSKARRSKARRTRQKKV